MLLPPTNELSRVRRVGLISDTHNRIERTAGAVALLAAEGAEILIHAGDLTTPEMVHVVASACIPCWYVQGNNDWDVASLESTAVSTGGVWLGPEGVIEVGGSRIGVTHGDQGKLVSRLLNKGVDYLVSGHTHVSDDSMEGSTRRINPGALHRASEWTVALLDLSEGELRFFRVA